MKINSTITSVGTTQASGRSKAAASTSQPSAAPSGEKVALSSLSASLQQAAVSAEGPVVDAARVAEIKQAITEGRFQINPERIADGLLENVRQMLAKQS
ncbi:MAG TPA: flagellar biosynthesis anti-sigma factor FlgM [Rhodocyclaceae bacterium]|nr:flagellar biosynthesis anti-sigma factor FlgM [Rhodocyclaceae bacterium]